MARARHASRSRSTTTSSRAPPRRPSPSSVDDHRRARRPRPPTRHAGRPGPAATRPTAIVAAIGADGRRRARTNAGAVHGAALPARGVVADLGRGQRGAEPRGAARRGDGGAGAHRRAVEREQRRNVRRRLRPAGPGDQADLGLQLLSGAGMAASTTAPGGRRRSTSCSPARRRGRRCSRRTPSRARRFERVVIDGERYVLKHVSPTLDWIARALRRPRALDRPDLGAPACSISCPDSIDHTYAGAARSGRDGAVLMHDVGPRLVPEGDAPVERVRSSRVPRRSRGAARARSGAGTDDVGLAAAREPLPDVQPLGDRAARRPSGSLNRFP